MSIALEAANRVLCIPVSNDQAALGHIVHQGGRFFKEQRQIVFNTGKGNAVAYIFIGQGT